MILPVSPNECWSPDFVSDAFTDRRRFRVLAFINDFTRECIGLVADPSFFDTRVTPLWLGAESRIPSSLATAQS
jgi:putative transposase